MESLVTVELTENGVADVRLNRPLKYNALSPEMFSSLIEAGESLMERNDVRVVVLSGNGRGFCAGLDMKSMQGLADRPAPSQELLDKPRQESPRPDNNAQRAAYIWKKLPMPVIVAIHGVAFGGGCQIAMGGDIRIAEPDARISVLEIKWGLIPDMSLTQTLRDLVPIDVAKELTFTGRILSGKKAKKLGLVTHVHKKPHVAAMKLASEIATKNPHAVRAGKLLWETSWHGDERTGLQLEARLQGGLIGSPNQAEAVRANMEQRSPKFVNVD